MKLITWNSLIVVGAVVVVGASLAWCSRAHAAEPPRCYLRIVPFLPNCEPVWVGSGGGSVFVPPVHVYRNTPDKPTPPDPCGDKAKGYGRPRGS